MSTRTKLALTAVATAVLLLAAAVAYHHQNPSTSWLTIALVAIIVSPLMMTGLYWGVANRGRAQQLEQQGAASVERAWSDRAAVGAWSDTVWVLTVCFVIGAFFDVAWLYPLTIWHVYAVAFGSFALRYARAWSAERR